MACLYPRVSGYFLFFCSVLPVLLSMSNFTNHVSKCLLSSVSFKHGMSSDHHKPDPGYSVSELGDFDRQVEQFVRRVRMSRASVRDLATVLDAVRHELSKLWTDFKLTPFGSAATGLALSTCSDIDVFVTLAQTSDAPYNSSDLVLRSAEIFKQNHSYTKIRPLYNISVPILRFLFVPTNQQCDVSFKKYDIVNNTPLLKYMFHLDNRALNLMIIIKHWAKINKIQLTYFIANIVWYKLVIFYLQQEDILPSVYVLQRKAEKTMIENWNIAFEDSYLYLYPSDNSKSLYEILGGFFEYFSRFNFERDCVSVFAGKPVARLLFESVDTVPDEFVLYKENLRNNISKPLKIDTPICVQRAFVHNDNVGYKVYPALLDKIKIKLMKAADHYRTKSERDFLSALLTVK